MCAIDDAERCDVWNEGDKKARKPHVCSECRREIAKGETYRRIDALYDGHWTTSRQCQHCRVGADWLSEECGGYLMDGVCEEIHEHAQEYRSLALWRLVAGADRKWKRARGGLMPVPRMPPLTPDSTRKRAA